MSRVENRTSRGRRLSTDAVGIPNLNWEKATAKQRFYSAYQYFRMEPAELAVCDVDYAAKIALSNRGDSAREQSFVPAYADGVVTRWLLDHGDVLGEAMDRFGAKAPRDGVVREGDWYL